MSTTEQQRRRFVGALNNMDAAWMRFLQDRDVLDINYSDLYTGLWLANQPVRKQEALQYMRHLSPQTAKKYLDKAISKGHLIEVVDPSDKRAKLIELESGFRQRLEQFLDHAIGLFDDALTT